MPRFRRALLLATASAVLLLPSQALAADWFVDSAAVPTVPTACVALDPCTTIDQAYANAAAGDTINVAAGSYVPNSAGDGLVVAKNDLTLNGAKAGISPFDGVARTSGAISESQITGNALVVQATGVTIDGFDFHDVVGPYASGVVSEAPTQGLTVVNSIFKNNASGIDLATSPAATAQTLVEDNWFDTNNAAGTGDGTGVYADGDAVDVRVHHNRFTIHNRSAVSFVGLAETQSDILVDDNYIVSSRGIALVGVQDLTFSGNRIWQGSDVAVWLGGANDGIAVTGNEFEGFTFMLARVLDGIVEAGFPTVPVVLAAPAGPSTNVEFSENSLFGLPGIAVFGSGIGSLNGYTGTLEVHHNRFWGQGVSIANYSSATTIDGELNWWSCQEGPSHACAGVALAQPGDDFTPYLKLKITALTASVTANRQTLTHIQMVRSDTDAVDTLFPDTLVFRQDLPVLGGFNPVDNEMVDGELLSLYGASTAGVTSLRASIGPTTSGGTEYVEVPMTVNAPASGIDAWAIEHNQGQAYPNTLDMPTLSNRVNFLIFLPGGATTGITAVEEVPTASYGPGAAPNGFAVMEPGLEVTAPTQDAAHAMSFPFRVYAPNIDPNDLRIFRNGAELPTCPPASIASVTACVISRFDNGDGSRTITVISKSGSFWAVGATQPTAHIDTGPGVGPAIEEVNALPTYTFHAEFEGDPVPSEFECQILPDDAPATTHDCDPGTYTPAALTDGPKTFRVQAIVDGLPSTIAEQDFFYDTVDPVPTITTTPPLKSNDATPDFAWTRFDPAPSSGHASASECSLVPSGDPPSFQACDTVTTDGWTGVTEGLKQFVVRIADVAGNTGTDDYTWQVDLRDPDTQLTLTKPGLDQHPSDLGPPTLATLNQAATFTFASTDPAYTAGTGNRFECRRDGGPWVVCDSGTISYAGLPHGLHTFDVRAIDDAGNTDPTPATWAWFIDLAAPRYAGTYPRDGGRYSWYKEVDALYECDDEYGGVDGLTFPSESGVATCTGTVPNGTPFDRTSLGQPGGVAPPPGDASFYTYPFDVTTSDNLGNAAVDNATYRVYTFTGLVFDDDPLAYFRMDDPDGSEVLTDVSGNENHGEYKNGTESGPEGISGDGNTSRIFTGQDGYGYVNDMPAPFVRYTMSAFVRFDTADDGMVMQHGGGGALFRRGDQLVFRQTSMEVALTVPGGIVTGCWYFVAGRWDGFTAGVYAGTHDDGPLDCTPGTTDLEWFPPVSASGTSTPPSGVATFYVGYGDQAPWLNGALDEVAYFPSALDPGHLNDLFAADPPPARGARPAAPAAAPAEHGAASSLAPVDATAVRAAKQSRARVRALVRSVAAAKARVRALRRRHASPRAVRRAQARVRTLQRQLARARAA